MWLLKPKWLVFECLVILHGSAAFSIALAPPQWTVPAVIFTVALSGLTSVWASAISRRETVR